MREEDLVAIKLDIDLRLRGWSKERIRRARRLLAQTRPREKRPWLSEEDARLGTAPDVVLARQLGRSAKGVKARRNVKRISVIKKWRPEDEKILGTRPDSQVAKLLGRSMSIVSLRRRKLGIPCFYEHRPWKQSELAMLGVKPDEEVARLTGHPLGSVEMKRHQLGRGQPDQVMDYWKGEDDKLLGTMPDEEVAKRIGRSVIAVQKRRIRLGIPNRFSQRRGKSPQRWKPEELKLFATLSNEEIARLLNRSWISVDAKRRRLGVQAGRS